MYEFWYGVPLVSINGNPSVLKIKVHEQYANAFERDNQIDLGDGDKTYYPWTSVPIIAVASSYVFTTQHSNLAWVAEGNQTGGLRIAFGDMASQAAQYYLYGKNDWKVGGEIYKNDGALRYLDWPSKDCGTNKPGNSCSINHMNDYNAGQLMYYTSGIFDRAFYLIATAPGWDVKKAFAVMVQANMHYWISNTQFFDGACGVIHATKDYGYNVDSVVQAFNAVGLDTRTC
jgi:Zn-dependent metalloprotease